MADKYWSDRKLHDLLAKHGTVDICDGISDALRESVIILASTRPDRQQKKECINRNGNRSAGGKYWSLNSSNGWMQTLLRRDSTVGRGCNAWIMKQALADQGHVLKYKKALCDISFSDYF